MMPTTNLLVYTLDRTFGNSFVDFTSGKRPSHIGQKTNFLLAIDMREKKINFDRFLSVDKASMVSKWESGSIKPTEESFNASNRIASYRTAPFATNSIRFSPRMAKKFGIWCGCYLISPKMRASLCRFRRWSIFFFCIFSFLTHKPISPYWKSLDAKWVCLCSWFSIRCQWHTHSQPTNV